MDKLFITEIVRRQKITCPDNLDWCEDTTFNLSYIAHTKHVMVLPDPIYFYTKQKGSLSSISRMFPDVMSTRVQVFDQYKNLCETTRPKKKNSLRPYNYWISRPIDGGYSLNGYRNPQFYAKRMENAPTAGSGARKYAVR